MLLKELFSYLDMERISHTLNEYHIQVPDNYQFSKINIVIGSNGSGKTRFLKAIRDLYKADESRDILYGYFPALSDRRISDEERDAKLPDYTLYEAMYGESVTFSDFFMEIEQHNEEFIPDLLTYSSRIKKERGEKAIKIIRESFQTLTGKELLNQEKQFFVKTSDGREELLSKALATLSPGELVLFYMSIFLAIQQNEKHNKVIILDEPESHLHPRALLSFIKLLTWTEEYKEIWIATHSLFVVPEFQFENITYICDSSVQSRTSAVYQRIFSEMLDDEEGKIRTFFSSLTQWQYCEFMAECFLNPTVIDTVNPKDEQVQLFIKCLKTHKPYRILDCGGGSGRLGLSLKAADPGGMKYICYEIYDREPAYTGQDFTVYKELGEIKAAYDCIVMMNFLHEVEPEKWRDLFHEIYTLMSVDAYLVFVEVAALRQGELPNESGYFVLGKEELEILFRDTRGLVEIKHKENQKSLCVLIPRKRLINVSDGSVKKAVEHLEARMLKELKAFREKENVKKTDGINAINARHFAFLTQQYINAKLLVERMEEAESKEKIFRLKQSEEIDRRCWILNEIKKQMIYIEYQIGFFKSPGIVGLINVAIDELKKEGKVSEQTLEAYWNYIVAVRRENTNKTVEAALLASLSLMGDSRGLDKLKNGNYIKYLAEELQNYISKIYG